MKQISFIILIGIIIGCDSENISQSDVINTIDDIENTVDDIENTVDDIEQKKQYNINVRQALVDIKDIQIKYKKAYGLYSDDYKELKRFLIEEKSKLITLRVPNGKNEDSIYKMIDMPITIEHQIILGYDHTDINDYKNISDGYNDDEALKCGLLIADTLFINMIDDLFPENQNNRVFPFNINKFQNVPFHKNKIEFTFKTGFIDGGKHPVFEVYDSKPYDPFNEGDTLKIGSLKEIKTNGNWQ